MYGKRNKYTLSTYCIYIYICRFNLINDLVSVQSRRFCLSPMLFMTGMHTQSLQEQHSTRWVRKMYFDHIFCDYKYMKYGIKTARALNCHFNRNSHTIPLNIFEGYDLDGIHEHKSAVEAVNAAQAIFIGEVLNNFTMYMYIVFIN